MVRIQILLWCLFASMGLNAQQTFTIAGNALEGNRELSLSVLNPELLEYEELATYSMEGSKKFHFEEAFSQANLYRLDYDDDYKIYISIEDPQSVQVKRTTQGVDIIGSASSVQLLEFEQVNGRLQQKHFGALKVEVDKAMAANDKEKLDSLMAQSQVAIQEFLVEFRQVLVDMGTTPAAYRALQFSDFNKELDFLEQRLADFQRLSPDALTTQALANQVYRAKVTGIGRTPPPIQTKDREDRDVTLEQFKGKILLVDFWAAWCRACRIENPKFVTLYEEYQSKGFEILSISLDETTEQWQEAIDKDAIGQWRHIWDKNETIRELYSISSLPQNVVLNRQGVIIAKNVSAEQLVELLKEVM